MNSLVSLSRPMRTQASGPSNGTPPSVMASDAHDADHVDGVLLVGHEGGGDDLDLVAEAVREGRADRAVDHAGGEGGLLGGTSLALEVAARDATGCVHLLVEVDGQREEVVVLALLGDDDRGEHGGVALLDQRGAGGLLGELAGLKHVRLAEQVKGLAYECHSYSYPHAPLARGLLRVGGTLPPIGCGAGAAGPLPFWTAHRRRPGPLSPG